MTKRTTKNPSRRIQVELELAKRLAELAVPELSGSFPLLSLTRLELTRDLKEGTVWVTAAPEVIHDTLITTMNRAIPRWRRALRPLLSLRYFPNLTIRYDEGQADLLRVEQLLNVRSILGSDAD